MIDRLEQALGDRYRIVGPLGEGGMATVYEAFDLRNERRVAIKVLKPELSAVIGADRFLAEIRTTANLQHPHILPLFDSGDVEGLLYYVMPLVDGESLRERLDRERQLPVDDAVRIATAVAGALDYAHGQGVIHRDIKPANILIHAGQPLVADFGIALAISAAGGGRMTETGLSLGTPYYMSPEQATADRVVDARSDLYSIGCVLYEMLAGEPPHGGGTAQSVIVRILTETPRPIRDTRPSVPQHVADAIACAMERLPADRFADASEFVRALGDDDFRRATSARFLKPDGARGGVRAAVGWPLVGGAVALALAGGFALGWGSSDRDAPYDVGLPIEAPIRGDTGSPFPGLAVSPDGSFIVYESSSGLWYRSLTDDESRPISGAEQAESMLHISPDGSRVAFADGSEGLAVVPIEGGRATRITGDAGVWGGSWLDDGQIFIGISDGGAVRWVDPETGPVRQVRSGYCTMPSILSETELLCGGGGWKYATVEQIDADTSFTRPVIQRTSGGGDQPLRGGHFRPFDDHIVYTTLDGSIAATKWIDRDSLVVGRSVTLVDGVRRSAYTGAGHFDVSEDGTLVFAFGANMEVQELALREIGGEPDILPIPPALHLRFNPSPDGMRVASVVHGTEGQELRVYDVSTGTHQVAYSGADYITTPFWSGDGESIVFQERADGRSTIYRLQLNANARPEALWSEEGEFEIVFWRDPDFSLLIQDPAGLFALRTSDSAGRLEPLVGGDMYFATLSPDGEWLAHVDSDGSLVVEPWPERDRRWEIMPAPIEPYWLSDGTLVLHRPDGALYTAERTPGGDRPFAPPELRFRDARKGDSPGWSVAITNDDRLLHLVTPDQSSLPWVRVIPGWLDQMKQAVDEANR